VTQLAPRRRLIVAIGDSFTSGEGNPDRGGLYVPQRDASGAVIGVATLRRARWQDRRCHRSAIAAPVLAARAIADGRTHLTLVHLACTGAHVRDGLLEPGGGARSQLLLDGAAQISSPAPAQVALTRRAVGRRHVDAVLVGIGGNELGFSQLVRTCATSDRCQDALAPAIPARLAALDSDLAALGVAMGPIATRRRVVLVPYPDVVTGGRGSCAAPELGLDPEESEWSARAIGALNGTLRRVAKRERWRFAGAAARALAGHGLCDSRPWSVSLAASVARQGSETGTLHPNPSGQGALALAVARSLRATIPR
jgi:lysophospholipase L1-like esterase